MTSNAQALLISNTMIAIQNGLNDLPQYQKEIQSMKDDMGKVSHSKLCLYILQALEEMYEGRYEA